MRKALFFTVTPLLLLVICFGFIQYKLLLPRDQVEITCLSSSGDITKADGLQVGLTSTYDNHLFWHTRYIFGDMPLTDTTYRFYATEQRRSASADYSGLMIMTDIPFHLDTSVDPNTLTGLPRVLRELYDSLKPGEEGEITFCLKDYYTYYPLSCYIALPSFYDGYDREMEESTEQNMQPAEWLCQELQKRFAVPVRDEDVISVAISRGGSENHATGISISGEACIPTDIFTNPDMYTEDSVFFAFTPEKGLDISGIAYEPGLYRLSYTKNASHFFEMDTLTNIYPMRSGDILFYAKLIEDDSRLLLFTRESGRDLLTEIDMSTCRVMQQLAIREDKKEEDARPSVFAYDDFIVTVYVEEEIDVIVRRPDKSYAIDLISPLNAETNLNTYKWPLVFYYRPGQLALLSPYDRDQETLAFSARQYSYDACGFSLFLYEKQGLVFRGHFMSNLNISGEPEQNEKKYNYRCRLSQIDPLTLDCPLS